MVDGLRLVNYFPTDGPHDRMWTSFDAAAIDRDMARIATLHGNAVRIILDLRAFSIPSPPPQYLRELSEVLTLGARHGVRAELTLFDQMGVCATCGSYTQVASSEQFADTVAASLPRGDARIAFIELQNQINVHDEAAMRWAQQLIPHLRTAFDGIPVTVSADAPVANLVDLKLALGSVTPDFWDFHYYYLPGAALSSFREARRITSPRPLLIGETGYSTFPGETSRPGVPATVSAHEAYQEYFLRTVEAAARDAGLPPAGPWILDDFPCPQCSPSDCILDCTPQPCTGCPQVDDFYGLYRADGSPKPAAATISRAFAGLPLSTGFNAGFEEAAGNDPADWRIQGPDAASFARDTTVAHTGRASARIEQSASGAPPPCWFIEPLTPVTRDASTLSAWVRGRLATGTTDVEIAWMDYQGQEVGSVASPPLPLQDTDWTLLTASGTPPPGAVSARILLCSSGNAGAAWFDDVSFGSGR